MRVLLVESCEGAGEDVRRQLVAEGHEVVECFDAGQQLCVGSGSSAQCPFHDGVDAAVAVRIPGDATPNLHEMGAVCAIKHRVPLVEVPGLDTSPFAGRAVAASGDIVGAVEAVAADATAHADAATAALRRLPALADVDPEQVFATARRQGDRLMVTLHLPSGLPANQAAQATTWAARAVRDHDEFARIIDFSLAH
jgi:hypothetical protein